jgi:hypothetical protein
LQGACPVGWVSPTVHQNWWALPTLRGEASLDKEAEDGNANDGVEVAMAQRGRVDIDLSESVEWLCGGVTLRGRHVVV